MIATTRAMAEIAAIAGLTADEQLRVLDEICSVDEHGNWVHPDYVIGVGGEILDARALAGLFLFGESLIVWVSDNVTETKNSFRRIAHLIEASPELRQHVAKIRRANGEQGIELHNGSRLLFVGCPVHARGLSADTLLIDGMLASDGEMHVGPALAAARNPQRVQRI